MTAWKLPAWLGLATLALIGGLAWQPAPAAAEEASASNPIPLLAYYYIWFDVPSWERAKTDYPLLGRYSSDDRAVMQQHIEWARSAGIDGFIVSWKSTDRLNRRLEQLISLAEEQDFKLAVIYQGLDFERRPLPVEQVAADLDWFAEHYASSPAFRMFEKPVVIWSGTWEFPAEAIAGVTASRREQLYILASEKNIAGYQRLDGLVDGNAYYWSSVNPDTHPGYPEKLAEMAEAVHRDGGLWIAPAAPGFDARLVGGTTIVGRKNGATLRRELDVALQSSPDAIGLISWNEFSENSHVEPSVSYGHRYLEILAEVRNAPGPSIVDFDSSEPGDTAASLDLARMLAFGLMGVLVFGGFIVILRRAES